MKKRQLYYGILGLIIAINLYYIYHFPLKYFNVEAWRTAFGPILITHIIFGMIAILIGPFQFFGGIRRKYPRVYRISGRIYLGAILIAALTAIFLAIYDNILVKEEMVFATGVIGLALAWLTTSGLALWAIRKRQFDQHREWMIRSYVVTCGFTTFRIVAVSVQQFFGTDVPGMGGIMAWACWAVPLLLTEVVLQARKIRQFPSVTSME